MFLKALKLRFGSTVFAPGLCIAAWAFAGHAHAVCLAPMTSHHVPPARLGDLKLPDPNLVPAVYQPGNAASAGRFIRVSDLEFPPGPGSIVGLWQTEMLLTVVPGTSVLFDFGMQAWHSDNTEFLFSGGQDPATGDVCQGVWTQTGRYTYTLDHVAFGWAGWQGPDGKPLTIAPTTTAELKSFPFPVNPMAGDAFSRVHIHFTITLDSHGNSFKGTWTAKQYWETTANPFNEDSNPEDQNYNLVPQLPPLSTTLSGTITGSRLQPAP